MLIEMFLKTAALPALLVAALVFYTGRIREPQRSVVHAVFVFAGYAIGFYFLLGFLYPTGGVNSLPWAALLLIFFVFISPRQIGSRYLVRALFVLALMALCLWPLRESLFSNPVNLRNLIAFSCLGLGLWSILEKAGLKVNTLSLLALPMIAITAMSLLFVSEGSATLGHLAVTLAIILGFLLVVALFKTNWIGMGGVLPFLSIFAVMHLVIAHFYVDVNPWRLVMTCWPFFVLWLRGLFPFIPKKRIPEAITLSLLAAAPFVYLALTSDKFIPTLS